MDYVIKIKTFTHVDTFSWENPELTDDFKASVLRMFTEWAVNDPNNSHSGIGACKEDILEWILTNIQGAIAFSSIGVKNETFVYGFFENPEDAALFKLTWINNG